MAALLRESAAALFRATASYTLLCYQDFGDRLAVPARTAGCQRYAADLPGYGYQEDSNGEGRAAIQTGFFRVTSHHTRRPSTFLTQV